MYSLRIVLSTNKSVNYQRRKIEGINRVTADLWPGSRFSRGGDREFA